MSVNSLPYLWGSACSCLTFKFPLLISILVILFDLRLDKLSHDIVISGDGVVDIWKRSRDINHECGRWRPFELANEMNSVVDCTTSAKEVATPA